jgi:hypothetical protein
MFRLSSEEEYQEGSEGGTRHLFALGHFEFHDTLDGAGRLRHFVLETGDDAGVFEAGREAMYEFMARYLAGLYEKVEYGMERSPAHEALLDNLELAAARARSGEADFSLDDLEEADFDEELEEESEEEDRA